MSKKIHWKKLEVLLRLGKERNSESKKRNKEMALFFRSDF